MANFTTDSQNEIFDVVNENDEVVGEATRGEVHQNPKLIHRAVHIWILNDKGEILLQQRSLTKDKAPGQWDISCAGHVKKGSDSETTAYRELKEELGVKADCKLVSKFIDRDIDQTEMTSLYVAIHNGPFKFPKKEIQQIKFFTKEKVLEFIKNDPDASLASKEEIPIVFEFLER
ncbi:NUDIX domain-containing protein [Candidatus Collierbacteria bacterium]|nr:NUDIX domain-containing protein [Candidatus Collierbacteria bacterium]